MKSTDRFKKALAITTISSLLLGQPVYAADPAKVKTSSLIEPSYLPALEVKSPGSKKVENQYADHQLLLKFRDGFSGESGLLRKYNLTVIKENTKTGYILASFTGQSGVENLVGQIQQETGVIHAQPNYLYKIFSGPNDPMYGRQWALPSISAVPEQSASAGPKNAAPASPVILAVLDTGVDVNHPDLKDRLVAGTNTTNPLKSTRDSEGHGTHVAGIAAASTNNGLGIAGIAGPNVRIMPIKVFDGDSGSDVSISDGIIWAADHGAKVINMSFGSFYKSTVLNDAIDYAYDKGVVMVAAAGNWASEEISYPAALSKVISVSAINKQNQLSDFSSYGPMIDVCAPGEEIYSTFWDPYKGSTYTELSGTSMASPMVAGVAAAMLAKRPQLKNEEIRQILEASATDLGTPGWDTKFGHGKINMAKALTLSLSKIDDKNGSMSKAVALASGETQRDKIDFGSDEDWYKISLPDKGHLQIEVLPAGKVSPGVEIYNSLGKLIASFNTGANQQALQNSFATDTDQRQLKVAEAVNGLVPDLIRGTYYIKVFGNHYRWTEETYSVTATVIGKNQLVQDKYEPNNTYKNAKTINTGTAVEGAVLDSVDQDWYKVKLTGKTYRIHLDVPAGLDLAVDVESEANYANNASGGNSEANYGSWFYQTINNGGLGVAEDALVVLPDKGSGNYYLNVYEVSGGSFNQNYMLKINEQTLARDAYEPNDTPAQATSIKIGQQVSGNFNVKGDNDWYILNADQEGVLKVTLKRPENSWCDLNLYADPKKSPVGQNYLDYAGYTSTDAGMLDLFQKERTYEFKVLPGKYYLNISSFDGGISDSYSFTTAIETFSFIDKELNDMPSGAIPFNNTDTKGTIYPANDIDLFSLELEKTQPLIVKVVPPADLDTHVVVMREASDNLGSHIGDQTGSEGTGEKDGAKFTEPLLEMVTAINTGGKGKPDMGVFTPSKPGKYYIIILAQGKSKTPYTLSIQSFTPTPDQWEDNSVLSKAKALACGTTIYPTFMGIEDQDWYKTYVGGKGKLEIRLDVPDDIDGVLEVYNQQGKLIARTDQSLIGEEEHLSISCAPGYYYIKTYDYLGNSSVQNYSLQVKLAAQTK